uniref:Uncharacterized protein n=1 Tax=Anguilla anguilla TaxID=7936 RepID=A0A0E9RMT1_ANGAN
MVCWQPICWSFIVWGKACGVHSRDINSFSVQMF